MVLFYLLKIPTTYQATAQLMTRGDMSQFPVYRKLISDNSSFKNPLNEQLASKGLIDHATNVSADTYSLSYSPADSVFTISAVSTSAQKAAKIANTTSKYFVTHVKYYATNVNIQIISNAQPPVVAYAPQKKKVLLFGSLFALVMAFLVGTLRGLYVGKITPEFLENNVDGENLGILKLR